MHLSAQFTQASARLQSCVFLIVDTCRLSVRTHWLLCGRRHRRLLLLPWSKLAPGCRKKKGMAARLASNSVRIVVAVLLLVACGGWLHSHKHKAALHQSLGEAVGKMNTATQERGASCCLGLHQTGRVVGSGQGGGRCWHTWEPCLTAAHAPALSIAAPPSPAALLSWGSPPSTSCSAMSAIDQLLCCLVQSAT